MIPPGTPNESVGAAAASASITSFQFPPSEQIDNSFMADMKQEFIGFKELMNKVCASIDFMSDKFDNFNLRMQQIENKMVLYDKWHEENNVLKAKVDDLSATVQKFEQMKLVNNVEIYGVPEKNPDNIEQNLKQIAEAIDFELIADDVVNIYRTKKNRGDAPKSIVVSFKSQIIRDKFIAAKNGKQVNTGIFDNTQNQKSNIYINEHLCGFYKKLLYDAKDFANKNEIKFVWIRDGNIFMRKSEGTKFVNISKSSDFVKVL